VGSSRAGVYGFRNDVEGSVGGTYGRSVLRKNTGRVIWTAYEPDRTRGNDKNEYKRVVGKCAGREHVRSTCRYTGMVLAKRGWQEKNISEVSPRWGVNVVGTNSLIGGVYVVSEETEGVELAPSPTGESEGFLGLKSQRNQ